MKGLLFVALAGMAGGVVNAIAGGGAFLILPTLMAIGLDPLMANGTLRIGLVVQTVTAVTTFHMRGVREWRAVAPLLPPVCAGALAGAWVATRLPAELFQSIIGWAFVFWSVILLIRPGRFLSTPEAPSKPGPWTYLATLVVGGYGGFMQAGVGLPLMAILVAGLGHHPVHANAIKLTMVLTYTVLAVPVFVSAGQVSWPAGVALACGMLIGGWSGVRLQLRAGASLVRWMVFAMVAISAVFLLLMNR